MSDIQWNSVPISDEEKPTISLDELRDMAADLDPDDFDEPVQLFLEELMNSDDLPTLRQAATLLLQDEIDLSPDLASMGVEPDEDLITLLIAVGADVNARNAYGQPPLHLAACYGYESIVNRLLTAGASLRTRDIHGRFAAAVAATPALSALLEPPYHPDDDIPLPPEIEDADYCPEDHNHHCSCGHDHTQDPHSGCSCGHHH